MSVNVKMTPNKTATFMIGLIIVPALLQGISETGSVDAHAIQPFYAGLLARACGLEVNLKAEGDVVVIATR